MAEKIVIASGKGGVGKSTIAVYLSYALAVGGTRVALIDADFSLNNVDIISQTEEYIDYDVMDVIEGKCRIAQAFVQHPKFKTLYILSSGNNDAEKFVSLSALEKITERIEAEFDYILIDAPAGIGAGLVRAVNAASRAFVVTTPHVCGMRDADKLVSVLRGYGMNEIDIVVNMLRGDLVAKGKELSAEEVSQILSLPLISALPFDDGFFVDEPCKKTLNAFRVLADNLREGKREVFDVVSAYKGAFGVKRRSL